LPLAHRASAPAPSKRIWLSLSAFADPQLNIHVNRGPGHVKCIRFLSTPGE
jgi:hypothetical protein